VAPLAAVRNHPNFQAAAPSPLAQRKGAICPENGQNLQVRVFMAS
jgi:hypothetical protein